MPVASPWIGLRYCMGPSEAIVQGTWTVLVRRGTMLMDLAISLDRGPRTNLGLDLPLPNLDLAIVTAVSYPEIHVEGRISSMTNISRLGKWSRMRLRVMGRR